MPALLRTFLFLSLLCCSVAADAADKMNSGIVYGANFAVNVEAPPGWVLDNKSGAVNGVHAAIYPEGGSWANSPAVMYANCVNKDAEAGTLAAFINADEASFRKHEPNITIKDLSADFQAGQLSRGMYFDNGVNKEAVVYVDEEKVVCMMVLSSKSEKDYDASLPSYQTFLKSYKFLTKNVVLPANPPEPAAKGEIE